VAPADEAGVRVGGAAAHPASSDPFARSALRSRSILRPELLAFVFVGGCVGGWLRYAVTSAWHPAPRGFPWATLTVNLAGAFVLSVVVVAASRLAPGRYLRPLVGTGFCGALTTFSSVVVTTDQFWAHDRIATGVGYLLVTVIGGLAAAAAGLASARAVTTPRGSRGER
jgi:CrcB protein